MTSQTSANAAHHTSKGSRAGGLTVQDLILVAVLLAAGAVLKLTVSSFLSFAGMKPNFIIAMYCLAIILVRPSIAQSVIIGLLAGLMCQIPMLNATPWVNIASETLGALACGLLIRVPMQAGKVNLNPPVATFLSTVVSGYAFAIIVGVALNGLSLPVTLATYAIMVFGTAAINCIVVTVLDIPLRKVLKRNDDAPSRVAATQTAGQEPAASAPIARSTSTSIIFDGFGFRYAEGDAPVLRDVSLIIPQGTFVGVTGAAGSGKSTLTYAINGVIPHCYPGESAGSVSVMGHDVATTPLTDLSRLVGSVCQDIDSQMVSSVVEDEVLYGLENFGVPKDQVERRLTNALEAMGIAELRHRAIDSLSGGQKQKVAIASIIALEPAVLVLDEPTAELDPASSTAVFDLLARYAEEHGTTVVVVEQKIALLSDYADTLLIMEDGRIRFQGAPADVLMHSDELLEIGVNCPRSTSLVNRLRDAGLYDGVATRNVAQACAVCKEVLA
ncbi:ATP-binding cassette domain-containing protein [Xiamenia xianingshaonis]|nr:ATP-binding cassette domain-containing protein [Xiamenia xianingshaonis]